MHPDLVVALEDRILGDVVEGLVVVEPRDLTTAVRDHFIKLCTYDEIIGREKNN